MRNWSISAGRVFGIDLRVHFTFPLLLIFIWLTETVATGQHGAMRGLALAAIIFGAVMVHELAHAVVASSHGVNVRSITLLPIGGITVMDEESYRNPNPKRDVRIALAGPFANLCLGVFFGCFVLLFAHKVMLFANPLLSAANLPRSLVWSNLLIGVLNLLPAYPLDGGRILRSWLMLRNNAAAATRQAVIVSQLFAMALIFTGGFFKFAGGAYTPWLLMLGFFIFVGAQMEDRSAVFQSVLESIRMEEVMLTDFATLSPADTLEGAMQKALHSLQDEFPVVRGVDMVGTISRQQILEILRTSGNGYVQGAMNRFFQVASRSETLASVLRRVGRTGFSLVPIVDDEHLVGIVTLQNLMHSISTLAETRRLQQANES